MNNSNIQKQARLGPTKTNARIASAGTNLDGRKRVRLRNSVRCSTSSSVLVNGGTSNLDIIVDRGVVLLGQGTVVKIGDSDEITGLVGLRVSSAPALNSSSFTVVTGPIVTGKWYWVFDASYVETHSVSLDERLVQGQLVKTTTITNATKTAATSIPFRQTLVKVDLDSLRALDVTSRVCESVTWTGGKIKGTNFGANCIGMYIGMTYNCSVRNVRTYACYSQSIYAGRSYGLTISGVRVACGYHGAQSDSNPGGYGVEISRTNNSTVSDVMGCWTRYCVSLSEGSSKVTVTRVGTGYMIAGHASVDIHGGPSELCTFTKINSPNADLRIGNSSWRLGSNSTIAQDCNVKALNIIANDQSSVYDRITGQKLRITTLADDDPNAVLATTGITAVNVTNSAFVCPNTENDRAFFVDDANLSGATTSAGINSLFCTGTTFTGLGNVYQAAYIGKLPAVLAHAISFDNCTFTAGPSGHAVAHNVDTTTPSGDLALTFTGCSFVVTASDRKVYYSSVPATYTAPISQVTFDGSTVKVGAAAPVSVDSSWVTRGTGLDDYPELNYL